MRKYNIFIVVILLIFSSCLKEEKLPIASKFSIEFIGEGHTSPIRIKLKNDSYGADFYQWTFEGGEPATSNKQNPGIITFKEAGTHKIILKVWNTIEEKIYHESINVYSKVDLDFDYEIITNDIAPAKVRILNNTKGALTYDWSFIGADIENSKEKDPPLLNYTKGGEYKIILKAFNGEKYFEQEKIFNLKSPMFIDFNWNYTNMEAPLKLSLVNHSKNAISYNWFCEGAKIENPTATESAVIYIDKKGEYDIKLVGNDGERDLECVKHISVKENTGILSFENIHLGINEAKNTIGCFFSSELGRTCTSKEIKDNNLGSKIDFGFFAINSTFDYCYFFSPKDAHNNVFPKIENAINTSFINLPKKYSISINKELFDKIKTDKEFNQFSKWVEDQNDSFDKNKLPHFVLFKTEDGRRGIIYIKDYVQKSVKSYIVLDIKIEKKL